MKLGNITYPELQTQADKWEEWLVPGFAGGLCTAFSDMLMENDQFPEMTNLLHELDGSLITRGPYRPYLLGTYDTVTPHPPLSFVFTKLGTTEYAIAAWDEGAAYSIKNWASTTWNATSITDAFADAKTPRFVKYSVNAAEDLIICNGSDVPLRWTGSGAGSNLGLTVPSWTTTVPEKDTETSTSRGIYLTGSYYYKLTAFFDGTATKYGESGPSVVTNAIASTGTVTDPKKLVLKGLPGLQSGTTKNYVYRSPVDELKGPFRYVGYYDTGTAFTDTCPNGEEGEECPIDAGTPPRLINPCVFQGRLIGGGLSSSATLTNKLVYSAKGQPDYFPALNFVYLQSEYMQAIPFNRNLYIFCKRHTYVVPDGDFDKYPEPALICEKGTSSARSVVDVGSGIVFQGMDNIYFVDFNTQAEDGDFPIPIGEPIKDRVRSVAFSATDYRVNSCACLHKSRYYLSMSTDSGTVNNSTFVWDVTVGLRLLKSGRYGAWSKVDWAANDMQSYNGTLYTADNTNKYIMEHEFSGVKDCKNFVTSQHLANTAFITDTDGTKTKITTEAVHGLSAGQYFTLSDATGNGVVYNGSWVVDSAPTTSTLIIVVPYVAYTPSASTVHVSVTYYPIAIGIRTKRLSFGHENARKLLGGGSVAVNTSGVNLTITPEMDDGTTSPTQSTTSIYITTISRIDSGVRSVITTISSNDYSKGDTVIIAGAETGHTIYNGTWIIHESLSSTQFVITTGYTDGYSPTASTVTVKKLTGYTTEITKPFLANTTSTAIARWDVTTIPTAYWVYETFGYYMRHMKFMRGLKGRTFSVRIANALIDPVTNTLDTNGAQDTRIVLLKLYYKMTTPAA
jgi:hypothetical protein